MDDASGRTRYRCYSPRRVWRRLSLLPLPLLFVLAFRAGVSPLTLAPFAALALFWLETSLPVRVEVGAEGVTFARLGWRRVVPYRAIESVEVRQREGAGKEDPKGGPVLSWTVFLSVVFTLKGGERLEVITGTDEVDGGGTHEMGRVGSFGATEPVSRAVARAVRERLKELRAYEPPPIEQALARGDRTVAEWLEALSRLSEPASGAYRSSTVDKETLWSILESPAAEPSARAGAALVLRKMLAAEEAPRARVAVESCDVPTLRVALEQALSGEEDDAACRKAMARVR